MSRHHHGPLQPPVLALHGLSPLTTRTKTADSHLILHIISISLGRQQEQNNQQSLEPSANKKPADTSHVDRISPARVILSLSLVFCQKFIKIRK